MIYLVEDDDNIRKLVSYASNFWTVFPKKIYAPILKTFFTTSVL